MMSLILLVAVKIKGPGGWFSTSVILKYENVIPLLLSLWLQAGTAEDANFIRLTTDHHYSTSQHNRRHQVQRTNSHSE